MKDPEYVASASNGEEAVCFTSQSQQNVIVMDLKMAVLDRLTANEEIIKSDQGAKILVLTSFLDEEMVIPAARMGATGILHKDTPPE